MRFFGMVRTRSIITQILMHKRNRQTFAKGLSPPQWLSGSYLLNAKSVQAVMFLVSGIVTCISGYFVCVIHTVLAAHVSDIFIRRARLKLLQTYQLWTLYLATRMSGHEEEALRKTHQSSEHRQLQFRLTHQSLERRTVSASLNCTTATATQAVPHSASGPKDIRMHAFIADSHPDKTGRKWKKWRNELVTCFRYFRIPNTQDRLDALNNYGGEQILELIESLKSVPKPPSA